MVQITHLVMVLVQEVVQVVKELMLLLHIQIISLHLQLHILVLVVIHGMSPLAKAVGMVKMVLAVLKVLVVME